MSRLVPDSRSAFVEAAFAGEQQRVWQALDGGLSPDSVAEIDGRTMTALAAAVAGGHREVVELLLEKGAAPWLALVPEAFANPSLLALLVERGSFVGANPPWLPTLPLLKAALVACGTAQPWNTAESLVTAWRRKPAPSLGAVIPDVARALSAPATSLDAITGRPSCAEVTGVCKALRRAPPTTWATAFRTLLAWERDPRLADLALWALGNELSGDTRRAALALFLKNADAGAVRRLDEVRHTMAEQDETAALLRLLERRKSPALTPEEEQLLVDMRKRVDERRWMSRRQSARVDTSPDDADRRAGWALEAVRFYQSFGLLTSWQLDIDWVREALRTSDAGARLRLLEPDELEGSLQADLSLLCADASRVWWGPLFSVSHPVRAPWPYAEWLTAWANIADGRVAAGVIEGVRFRRRDYGLSVLDPKVLADVNAALPVAGPRFVAGELPGGDGEGAVLLLDTSDRARIERARGIRFLSDPQLSRWVTNLSGDDTETELVRAAYAGDLARVDELLSAGISARAHGTLGLRDHRRNDDVTALAAAVSADARPVIERLLENGAQVTDTNEHGATALHDVRSADVAAALLERGALVNARTRFGDTALHHAVSQADRIDERIDVVRVLMAAGADPKLLDINKETALAKTKKPALLALLKGAVPVGAEQREHDALLGVIEKLQAHGFLAKLKKPRAKLVAAAAALLERELDVELVDRPEISYELARADRARVAQLDTYFFEDAPGSRTYTAVLKALAKISGKRFAPQKIKETWDDDGTQVELSFTLGTDRVHLSPDASEVFDPKILTEVNTHVSDGARFMMLELPATMDEVGELVVMVTPAEEAALQDALGWRFCDPREWR